MQSDYIIEMLNIRKEFPGIVANDNITLQLRRGEIHALLGENGAGKSTLMSVLFGLYQPEAGVIKKNGEVVKINNPNDATALNIGMVHQHFKLVDVFSVLDNIILGAEDTKVGFLQRKTARQKVRALSEKYKHADAFCEGLLGSLLALVGAPPVISSPYHKAIKLLSDPANSQSIEEIASIYNMSSNHFIRSFKQYVGVSPNAFRIEKRLEIAGEMLISTDLAVDSIAVASGYDDPLYFSRTFKKHMGISPTEYRKTKIGVNTK
jgi:AraC-like DNA-binding protein